MNAKFLPIENWVEIFGLAFSGVRVERHRLESQSLKRLPVLISDRFTVSSQPARSHIGHTHRAGVTCWDKFGGNCCPEQSSCLEPLPLMIETSVASH